MEVKVLLNSIDKIKKFVELAQEKEFDIDLISGRDVYLDAKSFLGVMSCDCRKPLIVDIHADKEEKETMIEEIQEYIVA